ncbi:bola protein [Poronia punctata]|nr:bola protein [Poronia punctata]
MLRRVVATAQKPAVPLRTPISFPRRLLSAVRMSSETPLEDAIRSKVTEALNPSRLEIYNDSHKHAHHKPMQGSTSRETHFRLVITSEAFRSKMQPARHRLVYGLLRDEMAAEGGLHALQLRTMTPEEEERQKAKEEADKS